jgi:hypothetical protein
VIERKKKLFTSIIICCWRTSLEFENGKQENNTDRQAGREVIKSGRKEGMKEVNLLVCHLLLQECRQLYIEL